MASEDDMQQVSEVLADQPVRQQPHQSWLEWPDLTLPPINLWNAPR